MVEVVHYTVLQQTKKQIKMGQAKLAAIISGSVNLFLYISAWFANLDSIKSTILFIMAVLMSGYRFYRYHITSKQNKKLKDIEIRMKELEEIERENELIRRNF
jgi:hypothetical protein